MLLNLSCLCVARPCTISEADAQERCRGLHALFRKKPIQVFCYQRAVPAMAGDLDYRDVIQAQLDGLETVGEFACGGRLTKKAPELDVQVWPAGECCSHCIRLLLPPAPPTLLRDRCRKAPRSAPLPPGHSYRLQGVGRIALPLSAEQAEALIGAAAQAPHGQGAATVVDRSVRRCWQLEPAQVAVGAGWQSKVERAVALAAGGLGLPAQSMQVRLASNCRSPWCASVPGLCAQVLWVAILRAQALGVPAQLPTAAVACPALPCLPSPPCLPAG